MSAPSSATGFGTGNNELGVMRSIQEFKARYLVMQSRFTERAAAERALLAGPKEPFTVAAWCRVCAKESTFSVDYASSYQVDSSGVPLPNWRETLVCPTCGMNNRVRCATDLLMNYLKPGPSGRIFATEQVTHFFQWLSARFPNAVGSEYLGPSLQPGQVVDSLRHEDLTDLSFDDESLDVVVSFDVLEHVPNYKKALAECLRCLRTGGILLASAPFAANSEQTIVRARINEAGETEHLLPPEYHGNPVRPEDGSLCYYYFGWDILEEMRRSGARDAYVLACYSRANAYMGNEQLFFVGFK